MRSSEDNFKIPIAFTSKKKRIGRFEDLPQFKWTDIGRQDVIGQGSFGAVFVTEYTRRKDGDSARKGETVVVKKLLGSSLDFIDAFAKEARLLYDLKHDNIVGFKAVCHDPVALMLEYVYFDLSVFGGEGQVSSLKDFMACLDTHNCEGIEGSFMTKIASDIAAGLLYLHERGIAHRDLKPANVLVSNHHYREEEDRDKLAYAWSHQPVVCKLTDFGESRSLFLQTRSVCQSRTLDIDRGTVPFMAPEILIGGDISRGGATVEDLLRVDMWAYGMLLFNLLNPCLHHPFQEVLKKEDNGDTKEKIIRFHRKGERLKQTQKYAKRCQLEWRNVWNVYEACTVVQPCGRPDATNALRLLHQGTRVGCLQGSILQERYEFLI